MTRRSLLKLTAGFTGLVFAGPAAIARECAAAETAEKTPTETGEKFPIIDSHIHLVDPRLPGAPWPDSATLERLRAEMRRAGVVQALCMPQWGRASDDPLGIRNSAAAAERVPGLHLIGVADPTRTDRKHLDQVERLLKAGKVKALKGYSGYVYHGPDSRGYRPYYRLAEAYDIPMIFHTGDTLSHLGKLKYAHPLLLDEVAVDFPKVKFVIGHFGCPWFADAAEVIYKNNKAGVKENVWADLSGILVGEPSDFEKYRADGTFEAVAKNVREAFLYAERPDRFLFGTDWPAASAADYRDFVLSAVPVEFHRAVLSENARQLFRI